MTSTIALIEWLDDKADDPAYFSHEREKFKAIVVAKLSELTTLLQCCENRIAEMERKALELAEALGLARADTAMAKADAQNLNRKLDKAAAYITAADARIATAEARCNEFERLVSTTSYALVTAEASLTELRAQAISDTGQLKTVLEERDEARKALERIAHIAHHNYGRQDEKMADIEPIARATLDRIGK